MRCQSEFLTKLLNNDYINIPPYEHNLSYSADSLCESFGSFLMHVLTISQEQILHINLRVDSGTPVLLFPVRRAKYLFHPLTKRMWVN